MNARTTRWTSAGGLVAALTLAVTTAHAQEAAPAEPSPGPESAPPVAPSPAPPPVYVRDEQSAFGPHYRSPGLAAALSLTPVPVDFGNLYAENVGWGMVYTGTELALAGGMMWLGAGHMCHRADGCGDWSGPETAGMVALVTGYVAVKVIAGVHASSSARDFNERAKRTLYPGIAPTRDGAALSLVAAF